MSIMWIISFIEKYRAIEILWARSCRIFKKNPMNLNNDKYFKIIDSTINTITAKPFCF